MRPNYLARGYQGLHVKQTNKNYWLKCLGRVIVVIQRGVVIIINCGYKSDFFNMAFDVKWFDSNTCTCNSGRADITWLMSSKLSVNGDDGSMPLILSICAKRVHPLLKPSLAGFAIQEDTTLIIVILFEIYMLWKQFWYKNCGWKACNYEVQCR